MYKLSNLKKKNVDSQIIFQKSILRLKNCVLHYTKPVSSVNKLARFNFESKVYYNSNWKLKSKLSNLKQKNVDSQSVFLGKSSLRLTNYLCFWSNIFPPLPGPNIIQLFTDIINSYHSKLECLLLPITFALF
jgi:hypothetical protein